VKAKQANKTAFPSDEIESLVEIAYKQVARNFKMFPELKGVTDPAITKQIIKLTERSLPITTTARNIEYEFYWEEKCKKELKNIKPELHGCSYKQAYIETHV
jgi:hypothetical protein